MRQASPRAEALRAGGPVSRQPELPRVRLDTRMPDAPAAGGRVIAVVGPTRSAEPARDGRGLGWMLPAALVLVVAGGLCWRYMPRRGAGGRAV